MELEGEVFLSPPGDCSSLSVSGLEVHAMEKPVGEKVAVAMPQRRSTGDRIDSKSVEPRGLVVNYHRNR